MIRVSPAGFIALCLTFCALAFVVSGCERDKPATADNEEAPPAKIVVVATTTMLADMISELGGEDITVIGIMKPGSDPHLYQPRPSDAKAVASADVVVTNGLHLEGWIDDLVENAGGQKKRFIVAGERVDAIKMESSPGGVDPHFWFDVNQWREASAHVAEGLIEAVGTSSDEAGRIRKRQVAYAAELERIDAWVRASLETIPVENRVLITSHDAFNYFGRSFEIDVVGIQGISTEQEASQRDVVNTIELVKKRGAPAVFVETSVNPRLIEQVAREAEVEVAGPLYSDSLGPADGPAASYLGMVSENVRIIVEALGGEFQKFALHGDG